jgi:hypothetical protein
MEALTITVKGKPVEVPSVNLGGKPVVIAPGLLKVATIHDEAWLNGQPVDNPDAFVRAVRASALKVDLLTFCQALPETEKRFPYHAEWENLAVAATADYKEWWNSLPQASRKNVRRAERRGVVVRSVAFDDALVRGIKEIYDETPYRQGRRFWHYGKDLETVRLENSSYAGRSEFIGAYNGDELVGFIKFVYQAPAARIMQIVAKDAHADKRVTNALLAKAVEICSAKSISSLIYGQYIYDNKADSPMTEFKLRNGFHQVLLPRYYIPLTVKGRIALALRLHRGIKPLLPSWAVSRFLKWRAALYARGTRRAPGNPAEPAETAEA